MNTTTVTWVLWLALLVLLPLPVYLQAWGWVPVWYVAGVCIDVLAGKATLGIAGLVVQLVVGVGLTGLLARVYGHSCAGWPARIRGSIVGIVILSLLLLFSTFPVYRTPAAVTFLTLYQ